jgi:hypothetical protein
MYIYYDDLSRKFSLESIISKNVKWRPGVVARTYNPSYQEIGKMEIWGQLRQKVHKTPS